jgi:hypothetical protein
MTQVTLPGGMRATVLRAECPRCEFAGSIPEVEVHDCAIQDSINASGTGRCEDYPCCGHTDGLGCQTTPEMTSAYWIDNPHLMCDHEAGICDAYDDYDGDED